MTHISELKFNMRKTIDAEPAIAEKVLKNQFVKLILQSLSKIQQTFLQNRKFVIVIDALNECERKENIQTILRLLEQTKDIKLVFLRVFVISRSKFSIRLDFKQMIDETYQNLILHEIARETIERDITLFLEHELAKIRERRCLNALWSKKKDIQILINMTMSFFIFAAIVCRFLEKTNDNSRKRLNDVLTYDAAEIFKQNVIYLLIMNHLFSDHEKREKKKLSLKFRNIVKFIIVLKTSFSIISLVTLLDVSQKKIRCKFDSLHAVLNISIDERVFVRLLHLSFRDFLFDSQKREKNLFCVNENETHQKLITKCLQFMCSSKELKQNMCKLSNSENFKNEINKHLLNKIFFSELRYVCRYWVHHVQHNQRQVFDDEQIYEFLQKYAFYWLKIMSLVEETSETIRMINILQSSENVWFFDILSQIICLICDTAKDESQTFNFSAKYKAIFFVNSIDHERRIVTIIYFDFDFCF